MKAGASSSSGSREGEPQTLLRCLCGFLRSRPTGTALTSEQQCTAEDSPGNSWLSCHALRDESTPFHDMLPAAHSLHCQPRRSEYDESYSINHTCAVAFANNKSLQQLPACATAQGSCRTTVAHITTWALTTPLTTPNHPV